MEEQWSRTGGYWQDPPPPGHRGYADHRPQGAGGQRPRFRPPGHDPFGVAESGRFPTPAGAAPAKVHGTPSRPPSGPPARVGSAVAALIAAVLTLAFPALFWFLGIPLLALLVNIPGIVFGAMALGKTDNPPEVERLIGYAWACTIVYVGLFLLVAAGVVVALSAV